MRGGLLGRLLKAQRAAVAPTVGISLFALIGVGGIAFDYARLASMDTELQNAADHAALAAASQLDGQDGACSRAAQAASTLIANNTRFANDGGSLQAMITNEAACDRSGFIKFYKNKDRSDTVDPTFATANYVEVTVNARTANYALTPIVAAFSATVSSARAYAGVGSSICGAVPFFICNPDEPIGNLDPYYPAAIPSGTGIVMAEGGSQWGPGNFGFVDQAGKGADSVAEALASDALYAECSPTENTTTETGNILNAVRDSLNMRFDYPPGNNATCKSPPCSPSTNVRKDVVRGATCSWQQNPATDANYASKRYRPTTATPLDTSVTPEIMGFPRDMMHSIGETNYSSRVGNGAWDRAAYFRSNHPGLDWQNTAGLGASVTRYQTYLWEAEDPSTRLTTKTTSADPNLATYGTPQPGICNPYSPVPPSTTGIDRRRLTAAVVNCRRVSQTPGLNGKKTIPVTGFIDVFMVEPSIDRTKCTTGTDCSTSYTSRNDVYIEVIGTSGTGEGGGTPQITRRDTPRLIE